MSEAKGPFDATKITPLFGMDWVLSLLRACREINKDKPEHQKWIDDAYHILEAAGKVDKEAMEFFLLEVSEPREFELSFRDLKSLYATGKIGIGALLEALPVEEEK
jgi:hypothetical protein